MNATKIKALALIKENKKIAEQKHGEFLEWLKKDPIIEEKLRRQNALKWDYVVSYNNVERSIIESKLNELDREIEEYFVEHNLDIKIARLTQTFGAGISIDDNRVFAQFAATY